MLCLPQLQPSWTLDVRKYGAYTFPTKIRIYNLLHTSNFVSIVFSCLIYQANATNQISEYKKELKTCGEAISEKDQKSFLHQIVPEFAKKFETRVAASIPSLDDKPL